MLTLTWKKKMVPPSTPFNMVKIPNRAGFCNNINFPHRHYPHPHHHPHQKQNHQNKNSNLLKDSHSAGDKTGKDERQDEKESPLADLGSHFVHLG